MLSGLLDRLVPSLVPHARWLAPSRTARLWGGWRPPRVPLGMAKRILVIRPDEIGDVVLTGPFLRALRQAAPQAHISLLVKEECRELVALCPHVDAVRSLPFSARWTAGRWLDLLIAAGRLKAALPKEGFDLVLLPRCDVDWYGAALIGHLLAGNGAVVRHRDARPGLAGSPELAIITEDYANPVMEHEVLRPLRFLTWCGAAAGPDSHLEAWVGDADRAFARGWLRSRFAGAAPLVVMHPSGGRSWLKQWPVEHFQATLVDLKAQTPFNILVVVGADEDWIAEAFAAQESERCAIGVGALGLRQLWAVLEQAALFIGGDCGPMHMASAAGTRVIGIFGPTSELRFRPWGANSSVVSLRYGCAPDVVKSFEDRCKTCYFLAPRCLTELPPGRVIAEARAACAPLLERGGLG